MASRSKNWKRQLKENRATNSTVCRRKVIKKIIRRFTLHGECDLTATLFKMSRSLSQAKQCERSPFVSSNIDRSEPNHGALCSRLLVYRSPWPDPEIALQCVPRRRRRDALRISLSPCLSLCLCHLVTSYNSRRRPPRLRWSAANPAARRTHDATNRSRDKITAIRNNNTTGRACQSVGPTVCDAVDRAGGATESDVWPLQPRPRCVRISDARTAGRPCQRLKLAFFRCRDVARSASRRAGKQRQLFAARYAGKRQATAAE